MKLNLTEMKAWIITRRQGVKNINEAIACLQENKVEHTFSPFRPIEILEKKRWDLCREIRELEHDIAEFEKQALAAARS